VQTFEPEITSPERGDARSAILNAARTLAQREGVESLTLGKVATEASLPRPVVFGQFVRKEDLLLCVAADSVMTLARKMGGLGPPGDLFATEHAQESAVILTLPRTETNTEMQNEEAIQKTAAFSEVLAATGSERRAVRGADAVENASPEAPLEKSSSRAPDAWLERRLRVFERAMSSMEARQERVEKDSRAMVVSAENGIKALEGTLNALVTRLEESEARQKASANDIRMALSEASLRIQTVEGVARAALVENDATTVEEIPFEPTAPVQLDVAPAPVEPKFQSENTDTPQAKSFLSAARASAIAAAASVETEVVKPKSSNLVAKLPYVIAGAIAIAVFIVAAGIAFNKGVRDGRNDALRQTTFLAPRATPTATAAIAPLDRLTKLAEAGNTNAELAIANRYLDSSGPMHDAKAGTRWMARAAGHGNVVAQYGLGSLYQRGVGTKADPVLAMHWFDAAALNGNRKAMHDLAIAYAEGLGGVKSPSEAVRWFSRAAGLGYVDSQFNLAVLYERGDGVPQNLVDAYKWYAIAAAQGDAESKLRVDALRTQLSAEDLAAAQRAADSFRAAPFDPAANLAPKL
jgi:TPR repeat protein/AcrR family transcriptional regulator